jgi:glucokinase
VVGLTVNVLVGDIGGTKTILALFSTEAGPRNPLAEITYSSLKYKTFDAMVCEFQESIKTTIDAACFGVAGPVVNGKARVTNLAWVVDGPKLQSIFHWSAVALLNDLESVGYAIPVLEKEDLYTLSSGNPASDGCIAVIAPGTGLGEGFLTKDCGSYHVHPSEGSHAAFAPVGALQIGLLNYLNACGHKHVSYERVCSGGLGIPNLYAYLKTTGLEEPGWLTEKLKSVRDPSPVIVNAAHDTAQTCQLATTTLSMFVSILGAEAGNLALKVLSTGGIYFGGGISPRVLVDLKKPEFLEALRSKGRFRQLLTDMPVHVILNAKAGLFGAAAFGLGLLTS